MAKNLCAEARWLRAGCLLMPLLLCVAPACGTKVKLANDGTSQSRDPSVVSDGGTDDDADAAEPSCSGLDDGAPCGEGRHCIKETCLFNTCGDGVVAGNEECDDGNEVAGDACNPACRSTPVTCGNAHIEDGEECDDGNDRDDDACSNGCTLNRCGNMRRDPGEECDRLQADDMYCTSDCKRSVCRDGRLDPGEECDDGNAVNNDGCTNDCKKLSCGDGNVDAVLMEECDDGNQVDDDKCSNACTRNECGNKRLDPGEVCDSDTTDEGACNATCTAYEDDKCAQCLADNCVDFNGFNVYDACLVKATKENLLLCAPDPTCIVAPADFTDDCRAFYQCTQFHHCLDSASSPVPCVCGDVDINTCSAAASFDDLTGPCVDEGKRAANKASTPDAMLSAFQDVTYPSGYVFFLSSCRVQRCAPECGAN